MNTQAVVISATAAAALLAPDLNRDGVVGGVDLAVLLNRWGQCAGCDADINRDGAVDAVDMSILLNSFGAAPVVVRHDLGDGAWRLIPREAAPSVESDPAWPGYTVTSWIEDAHRVRVIQRNEGF